jgi:uncharacterized protein YjbI with pentapeptide repeats
VDHRQQQSRWRPTRRLWWAGSIIGVVALLFLLIRLGYAYQWTGFGQYKVNGEVQPFTTLWDLLNLLIVPLVLGVGGAVGGYLFTRAENRSAQIVEEQRAQDTTLQAYLDQMGSLLLDHSLLESEMLEEVRDFARIQTLTALNRLEDPDRKRTVLQFLYEAGLIYKPMRESDLPVIILSGADLRGSNLEGAWLSGTSLEEVNLRGSNLKKAQLDSADLLAANLSKADLSEADLTSTILADADLSGAIGITNEELAQRADSLKGATMPNGQKYEDWLKDREKRQQDQ